MSALILSEEKQKEIDAAVARAREKPMSLEEVKRLALPPETIEVTLADQTQARLEKVTYSQCVEIDVGYMACISFEEQPAGLCRHLSVSVARRGRLPHELAVEMIAKAFGFQSSLMDCRFWLEEIGSGQKAVNMVELVNEVEV